MFGACPHISFGPFLVLFSAIFEIFLGNMLDIPMRNPSKIAKKIPQK
jgi:hypothetical protein